MAATRPIQIRSSSLLQLEDNVDHDRLDRQYHAMKKHRKKHKKERRKERKRLRRQEDLEERLERKLSKKKNTKGGKGGSQRKPKQTKKNKKKNVEKDRLVSDDEDFDTLTPSHDSYYSCSSDDARYN